MIARVATFKSLPADLDDGAVDLLRQTVRQTPGYVAAYHLRDPSSNKALSITIYENQEAVERVRAALSVRPDDRKVGIDPDEVEFFEAFPF